MYAWQVGVSRNANSIRTQLLEFAIRTDLNTIATYVNTYNYSFISYGFIATACGKEQANIVLLALSVLH